MKHCNYFYYPTNTKLPIFCPVCLLCTECSGQSLSSCSEQSTHIHTPFRKEKHQDSERGVGSFAAQAHKGGHFPHSAPLPPASPTQPTVRVLPDRSLLPRSPRRRTAASKRSLAARPRTFAHSRFPPPSLGSRKTLRTGPALRRMLSSEQVQFASRKLQRYTGVGGGTPGQRDCPTTTAGLSPPSRPQHQLRPTRVASLFQSRLQR